MNWLSAGPHELRRKVLRLRRRILLRRLQKDLVLAETELGWLTWEQTDFAEEEMLAEIAKIRQFEKAQAALVNEGAVIGERIRHFEAELAAAREVYQHQYGILLEQKSVTEPALNEITTVLDQEREALQRFDKAVSELEREEQELASERRELLAIESPTLEVRTAIIENGDRNRAIGDELQELSRKRSQLRANVQTLDQQAAALKTELRRIEVEENVARKDFEKVEVRISRELQKLQHLRSNITKRMRSVDREKLRPYLRIGHELANLNFGPRNQPYVLDRALDLRAEMAAIEQEIADSFAETAATSKAALWSFYIMTAAVILALAIGLVVLLRR